MLYIGELGELVVGRVEPRIYMFATTSVPRYIKVGDTYRPVDVRIKEWKNHYKNIELIKDSAATTNDGKFFRDYEVHDFLKSERGRERAGADLFKGLNLHYSNEFFKDVTVDDFDDAINDILSDSENQKRYKFYNISEVLRSKSSKSDVPYPRDQSFEPRKNQQDAIDAFKVAVDKNRNKLLMYAVMRFGKSFTAMCCAIEMEANLVVVVSGKADVRNEWRYTVQSHERFDGYKFVDSKDLKGNHQAVSEHLEVGKVVVFLTLQDLKDETIKEKHKDIFAQHINLLIVDETHFGARASQFGKVLNGMSKSEYTKQQNILSKDDDLVDSEDDENIKNLEADVTLHLSGTPYRILMGDEFPEDSIISFCQFSDIVDAQQEWDIDNFARIENGDINPATGRPFKEWDNPYYGFPQMLRFAFNPNQSSIDKLKSLREQNVTYAFSALLEPQSTHKSKGSDAHRIFKNEKEVLDLFEVIDGSKEDDNLLGFLDYDKIKQGKMCRHIVCVLPYRASCDALEELLTKNSDKFKNLCDYEILNIAGLDLPPAYKSIENIKKRVEKYESEDKKTLTLTVGRMLTGSTVEEWDTMIFLKDTASPQEYDQAIFRLQNPYIKEYKDNKGDIIKFNMKPQTLLVDFSPNRMFYMQSQKSLIYNANVNQGGRDNHKARIEKELEISPIIVVNKSRLERITPTDLVARVVEYSRERSVLDVALDIPVDFAMLSDEQFRAVISSQNMISSNKGFSEKLSKGPGSDMDIPDAPKSPDEPPQNRAADDIPPVDDKNQEERDSEKSDEQIWREKFARYYSRMLFFVFLSKNSVDSVDAIVRALESNDEADLRIAKNLEIELEVVKCFKHMNHLALNKLDDALLSIMKLREDDEIDTLQRAKNATARFGRISEAEITTPSNIAKDMVALFPSEDVSDETKFLDIASKQGEFAIAILERFGDKVKNNIYSLPTSSIAYEFTRKIYEALGLPVENVMGDMNIYQTVVDVLNERSENKKLINKDRKFTKMKAYLEKREKLYNINFDIVTGNPPYQLEVGVTKDNYSVPLYDKFIDVAKFIEPEYISLIIPSRWFAGGRGLDEFRADMLSDTRIQRIYDFPNAVDCFPSEDISGGVCYYLWDKNEDEKDCLVTSISRGKVTSTMQRPLLEENCDTFIRSNEAISAIRKIKCKNEKTFDVLVSPQTPFGILSSFKDYKDEHYRNSILIHTVDGPKYINRDVIRKNPQWIDTYKVYISKSYGERGSYPYRFLAKPYMGGVGTCCTQTYLMIGPFVKEIECINIINYIKSKFFRFCIMLKKNTQDAMRGVYSFVPMQDFASNKDIDWSKSIEEIDKQLYKKYGLTKQEQEFIEQTIKPMG